MLADRIADFLFKGGNITDEEKEIICFGLESLEGNLLGIGLTLIVGMCFRQVREAILLWWLLFPLRKNAGGYHAKTKTKCMLISLIIIIKYRNSFSYSCMFQFRIFKTVTISLE